MSGVSAAVVTYDRLDYDYPTAFLTDDGDILPPKCWMEVLDIEPVSSTRWAVEHLKGLIEAYEMDTTRANMTDGEMVLVAGVDMFLAGLALGLVHEGRVAA